MTGPLPGRSWIAIVPIVIGAAIAFGWFHARPAVPGTQPNGITVVRGQESSASVEAASARPPVFELPGDMLSSLKLTPGARLREPLPDRATGSILCGAVSADGGAAPYRRFVFNRAARTGALDDGSDLFKRFADKICRQR